MKEFISAYVKEIDKLYQTGLTTEHSFRPALAQLLRDCTGCIIINEQTHIDCGAPDLTLVKNKLPIAYVEAKDLNDTDLDGKKKNKEQFDRYKKALKTIAFTDYTDFHLYEDGEPIWSVRIAYIQNGHIVLSEDAIEQFVSFVEKLRIAAPQKITSAKKLALLMAEKARMLAKAIVLTLGKDEQHTGKLWTQLTAFKDVLNKDLDEKKFADLYAQTIAYGMFAARLHDKSGEHFTSTSAANLIPKTNPFLRQVFQQIAVFDVDPSISWIVEDLGQIFAATDINKLRKSFGAGMMRKDPMIHFYEDFLFQYDPEAKKQCGVYYTPQPVVEFIVRAVDDILKNDFQLPTGLADTSKVEVTIKEMADGDDTPTFKQEMRHRVQVLDPAMGTGTFLAEVVNRIKDTQQKGIWPLYVDEHLIPRLHGFELMMAPYTIAHLKMDMLINWWGEEKLQDTHEDRLQLYLTNSLNQAELVNKHLLADMIAKEANEANNIKHNAPVMIVMGNPPYSVSSSNKDPWIIKLLDSYKKDLNEKNIQPLSDDYIKFIRLGQYYIDRTGEGILAYISNNSFLDGLIHRQMRRELMQSFDDIYILDLHGNSRKKETTPDGNKDENVFSIMQGVSINIFVKKKNRTNSLATIHHYDLFGTRKEKYAFLLDNSLSSINWQTLSPQEPNLFFVPKDTCAQDEYERGFKMDVLMNVHVTGLKSQKDTASIFLSDDEKERMKNDFLNLSIDELKRKHGFEDGRDWQIKLAKKDLMTNPIIADKILYRPFDFRHMLYTGKIKGIQGYPRYELMRHLIHNKGNIGLLLTKRNRQISLGYYLATDCIPDLHVLDSAADSMQLFPLYLYPNESELGFESERHPNLDEAIWAQINTAIDHETTPEDIFDYIYGVLHSPTYRAKYKEFLKVDFPRIPYPKNADEFEHFRSFGNQLAELHLMHNVPASGVEFPEAGSTIVEKVEFSPSISLELNSGKVFINATQYFSNVSKESWEIYIGGYQPAQKWLKDRRGRTLSYDDIQHYRRIIAILCETSRLMQEIDNY